MGTGAAGLGGGVLVTGCGVFCSPFAGDAAGAGLAVVSGDEDVCCPIALNVTSRKAVNIDFQMRITQILSVLLNTWSCSVRQLENHMHGCGGIYRLIVVLCRLKAHFVGGGDRRFVQTVTQAPHHAIHMQLPVCSE